MTYGFPYSALGYERARGDTGLRAKFAKLPLEKDMFKVEDCNNASEKRLLQFLVPILNPDKATTCTMKLLKAI